MKNIIEKAADAKILQIILWNKSCSFTKWAALNNIKGNFKPVLEVKAADLFWEAQWSSTLSWRSKIKKQSVIVSVFC